MRFDHIGFLTTDISREMRAIEALAGPLEWTGEIIDPLQDVKARFGRSAAGLVYELLSPLSPGSPIAASLKKKTNIIHHVCYRTDDLTATSVELRHLGAFPVTEPRPAIAFGGGLLQFFYQPGDWLVEIVEGTATPFDAPPG